MTQASTTAALAKQLQAIRQRVNANAPLESLMLELARQQALIDDLALQVRVLRAERSLGEALLPRVETSYGGLDRAHLDAGMPLDPEKGFYALEYDGNGQPFRWTGPQPVFSFDLHLDRRGPLAVALQIASGYGEVSDRLRAFSDGVELPLTRQTVAGGVAYSLVLLPRAMPGITRLSFLVKKLFTPAASHIDQRKLGVVFRELDVVPATPAQAQAYLGAVDDLARIREVRVAPVDAPDAIVAPETAPAAAEEPVELAEPTPAVAEGPVARIEA